MKTRMLQVTLFASLVLSTPVASGQRGIEDRRRHWWLFGVNVDNKLGEASLSNNVYLVEFKDTP